MSDDIVYLLNLQAKEIAEAGHNGWGNTMISAAKEIESLRAQLDSMYRDLVYHAELNDR